MARQVLIDVFRGEMELLSKPGGIPVRCEVTNEEAGVGAGDERRNRRVPGAAFLLHERIAGNLLLQVARQSAVGWHYVTSPHRIVEGRQHRYAVVKHHDRLHVGRWHAENVIRVERSTHCGQRYACLRDTCEKVLLLCRRCKRGVKNTELESARENLFHRGRPYRRRAGLRRSAGHRKQCGKRTGRR